ncbi:MAG: N-acetylmuramic acid 6-phosphate etherase [Planctomycetota bacterium]
MEALPRTEVRSGAALDLATPRELARAFQAADREAVAAVAAAEDALAAAIERAAEALGAGGRVVLVGAGTSGRLAVLEAAECIPTFACDRVVGLLAGGAPALLRAKEGAEDDRPGGARDAAALGLEARDFLLGVTASGRTPYVFGALDAAAAAGTPAGLLCCSPPPPDAPARALTLLLETGPEVLTGSTRLKAGTATKCALNAVTTGAMARLGKVMDDLMVDVVASNEKLRGRARRIVAALAPGPDPDALLAAAAGEVKTAVVAGRLGLLAPAARALLAEHGGHLRRALEAGALEAGR